VVAINGTGFAIPLRVEIGTFVARVISVTPTQIVIETPAVTDDVFLTEPCNDNADEQEGTRLIPTAFDVTVTDITSGDSDTLANAFIYDPADSSCRNDVAPPPPPPPPPVASFTFTASGLTVIFDNTSTDFVSSQWSFGDGTVSAASDPTHTYAVAGTFVVTLTVRNSVGQADTTSQFVTVPPP
jgi:PKD repeat protein